MRLLQRQLKARGYVVGEPGLLDARTSRAVGAFRKLAGMARTEQANEEVFRKLAKGSGYFKVRFPDHGHHAEGDLSHQVLALIASSWLHALPNPGGGSGATAPEPSTLVLGALGGLALWACRSRLP